MFVRVGWWALDCARSVPARISSGNAGSEGSADVFDDLDRFVQAVALLAGEIDEFLRSLDDSAALGRACDGDAASAPAAARRAVVPSRMS
jgi:hypothetical protein